MDLSLFPDRVWLMEGKTLEGCRDPFEDEKTKKGWGCAYAGRASDGFHCIACFTCPEDGHEYFEPSKRFATFEAKDVSLSEAVEICKAHPINTHLAMVERVRGGLAVCDVLLRAA